jgi:hypothetical protein
MKLPTYFGNYLGIVVQNNDPLKRGRVKIFIPHVSPSVYSGWNSLSKDKKFKFIGKNLNSDLTDIQEELKIILPWAECASPLVGENTSGRFNASLNAGSISDSSKNKTFITNKDNVDINTSALSQYSQNYDNIGEKPANMFDINYFKIKDAFSNPQETNVNNVNKFSYSYTPEAYSNSAKGSFSIPCVGSHLWVFFVAGDALKPVYFATSFGAHDWSTIYSTGSAGDLTNNNVRSDDGVDYPGEFENKRGTTTELTYNAETYRNKFVINQKGGTLAFVNTDNKESVKLTHYSGSFKELNNFTNIELATKNDQKLVLEDSFLTVQGDRNEYTGRDYDLVTTGNFYKKIGKIDPATAQEWRNVVNELADTKQLFDIKRANKLQNSLLKFTSNKQNKTGNPAPCPVCKSSKELYFIYNISYKQGFKNVIRTSFSDSGGNYAYGNTVDKKKSLDYPGPAGAFVYTLPVSQLGGSVDGSSFNSTPSKFLGNSPCPACGGSGNSPSSQDGNWSKEEKQSLINRFFESNLDKLSKIEKKLGLGGSEIIEIAKHKIETVGTLMNDFGSIRIDDKGKMEPSEVIIAEYGSFLNRAASPVHEYVSVTDLPGGNYTLNVCNRFNCMVGAGGINLKSYGSVNISGTITNVAGEQVNVGAENEINIDGGKRVSIIADIVAIRQRNRKQVLVDSSLGVSKNAIVLGGGYFEGELHVQHITAPAEVQNTNKTICFGAAVTDQANMNGKVIGFGVPLSNWPVKGQQAGYKENGQDNQGEPYIGFTDSSVTVARLEKDITIGYIPATEISSKVKDSMGGFCSATGPLIVKASSSGSPGGGDVPCKGSGPGTGDFSVRGSVKGADTGSGGSNAAKMPIIVYGTGRDDDSIVIPEHSHMFKNIPLTLMQTNQEVRTQAISLLQGSRDNSGQNTGAGGEIAPEGPIVNADKGTN